MIQQVAAQIVEHVDPRPVTGIVNDGANVEEAESADSESARSDRTRDSPDVVFQHFTDMQLNTENSRFDSPD